MSRVEPPIVIAAPPAEGKGINAPQPAARLPDGYVEEEYFVGGVATRFDPVDTPDDGFWTVVPAQQAGYRTRVIVRRPADPAVFSGTVLVEWFNVSAIEASPDWGYLYDEIGREHHVYIGVSVQAQGVEGGETILDVEVEADQQQVSDAQVVADKRGLRQLDPERYGALTHPGDAYGYDVFGQVGRAATEMSEVLLAGLRPDRVIAIGESQSAMFLTTYINAVHSRSPVFDGFLVHSRGATVPGLDGCYVSSTQAAVEAEAHGVAIRGVKIRTDLDVPVLIFETETDLNLLGYAFARQPDSDRVRTWEVAGTSHADAQHLRALLGGPRDPAIGALLGCGSINTGLHKEVLSAALNHLVRWAAGEKAPPTAARLATTADDGHVVVRRDGLGNALGGVRNPMVDVPLASLSGDPAGDSSIIDLAASGSVCLLFGSTAPFDQATLVELYGTAENYVARFVASAEGQVAEGFLLRPDADDLIAEAEANRSLFP